MQDSTSTIAIVIGAFVTIIGGFGAIAKIMLTQSAKDRDSDRDERLRLSAAIEHMAQNSSKVAEATVRTADEAKQRNGHLAELIEQSKENTKALAESATNQIITAFTAVQNVKHQHVEQQTVEHETVEDKKGKK